MTMIAAKASEPGAQRDIVAHVLAVLDRGDVVTARNRLERQYGMAPLQSWTWHTAPLLLIQKAALPGRT